MARDDAAIQYAHNAEAIRILRALAPVGMGWNSESVSVAPHAGLRAPRGASVVTFLNSFAEA